MICTTRIGIIDAGDLTVLAAILVAEGGRNSVDPYIGGASVDVQPEGLRGCADAYIGEVEGAFVVEGDIKRCRVAFS